MQYDGIKKKIQSIRAQTLQITPDELKGINATVNTLENQLKLMAESPGRYDLVASEIARRQVLVENLKKVLADGTLIKVRTAGQPGAAAGNNVNSNQSRTEYNPMTMSDRALVQRQKDVIKMQDEMLVDIEKGVGRLHEKALEIGDETKLHTRLLDDLDSNVDIATAALQAEAKHAEKIKEQTKMCWMYICIIVEVMVLVLLLVLMFSV